MSFIDIVSLISGFCSISGVSLLSIYHYFAPKTKYKKLSVIRPYVVAVTVVFLISVLIVWIPWHKFHYGETKPTVHDTLKTIVKNPVPVQLLTVTPAKLFKKDNSKQQITQSNNTGDNIVGSENNKGKNNFNGGKNNQYNAPIHVGDLISNESSLDDSTSAAILLKIKQLQKRYTIKNNTILLHLSESNNQRKLSFQLQKFLEKTLFQVNVTPTGEVYEGIEVKADTGFYAHEYNINIMVGTAL